MMPCSMSVQVRWLIMTNHSVQHQTTKATVTKLQASRPQKDFTPLTAPLQVNTTALLALPCCKFWAVFTCLGSTVHVAMLYNVLSVYKNEIWLQLLQKKNHIFSSPSCANIILSKRCTEMISKCCGKLNTNLQLQSKVKDKMSVTKITERHTKWKPLLQAFNWYKEWAVLTYSWMFDEFKVNWLNCYE
jgi:hypothetical protein